MELVAAAGRPVTGSDLIEASGLPKPTCYRLMQSLQEQGLLDCPNDDGRFVVGERLIRIALLGKSDNDVCRGVRPLLTPLATRLEETVFLARLCGDEVEIILIETPADPAREYIHPGLSVRPLHACSCSKAIAAFAAPEFQERILESSMCKFTDTTRTTRQALTAEFDLIRQRGFADCDQEIDVGIASVAAPVTLGKLGATFSVGVVGPVRRFGRANREEVGNQLVSISNQISAAIRVSAAT